MANHHKQQFHVSAQGQRTTRIHLVNLLESFRSTAKEVNAIIIDPP